MNKYDQNTCDLFDVLWTLAGKPYRLFGCWRCGESSMYGRVIGGHLGVPKFVHNGMPNEDGAILPEEGWPFEECTPNWNYILSEKTLEVYAEEFLTKAFGKKNKDIQISFEAVTGGGWHAFTVGTNCRRLTPKSYQMRAHAALWIMVACKQNNDFIFYNLQNMQVNDEEWFKNMVISV